MFVETTITEVKKNRVVANLVVDYVNPDVRKFITDDGTAVVHFDEHDGWTMHIKREQALLLVEWAESLVRAFDDWESQ